MFEYKIPQEIKEKFTKEFMTDFLAEIIQEFDLVEPMFYFNSVFYLEGTYGWVNAFKHTCQKHKMEDVFMYYHNLMWYDSDLFDNEIGSLLIEYDLVKK